MEKTPEIMLEIDKNYRLFRRVYQSPFVDIADVFIQYIRLLELDEIKQLEDNIRANGWGVESIVDIQNYFEFLQIFILFYYFLLLTNGLLQVPDGETPTGVKKISLKKLSELFKDIKSHGFVSLQFLSALNFFFGGSIENLKNTISELYQNLTFQTLANKRNTIWMNNRFSFTYDMQIAPFNFIKHWKKELRHKDAMIRLKKNITLMKNLVLTIRLKSKLSRTY